MIQRQRHDWLRPGSEQPRQPVSPEMVGRPARPRAGVPRGLSNQALARLLNGPRLQRVRQTNVIDGVTHLVQMVEGDLYREDFESNEVRELETPDTVTIETNVSHRSRRGPNQEVNAQTDKQGPPAHLWYQTLQVNQQDLGAKDVYVRDDTYITLDAAIAEKISELGLVAGAKALAPQLVHHIMDTTGCPFREMKFTASSGSSLTVIPRGGVVFQLLGDPATFSKVANFASTTNFDKLYKGTTGVKSRIPALGAKYAEWNHRVGDLIAQIVQVLPNLQTIVVEKVEPLNALFAAMKEGDVIDTPKDFLTRNRLKIIWDIRTSIQALAMVGYTQNDVRLDNIGIKDGRFVLFDYDGVASPEMVNRDLDNLKKSLQHYNVEGIEFDFLNLLRDLELPGETMQEKIDGLEKLPVDRL